jgi:nucleotide-binding universal stress UspA family protein
VCGIDDTEAAAQRVLDTARRLASAFNAHLIIAHAFDEPVGDAEKVMTAIRRETEADHHVEIRLVEGAPAERLLEIAREEDAEFLVVGSRGRGALESGLLGSVSRTLVQKASCPVAIVPPNASALAGEPGEDGTIVCGVDGSEHALAAARLAGRLGRRLGYRVAVVHAPRSGKSLTYLGRDTTPSLSQQPDQVDRRNREIVEEAFDVLGDLPSSAFIEPGRPDQVLEAVASREHGRMIVIAGRGTSAVHAAILGSVALSLVSSAEVPVVVLPEGAEKSPAEPEHADEGAPTG